MSPLNSHTNFIGICEASISIYHLIIIRENDLSDIVIIVIIFVFGNRRKFQKYSSFLFLFRIYSSFY